MNLKALQFTRCLQLATAHGHHWAAAYQSAWNVADALATPTLLDAAVAVRRAHLTGEVPLDLVRKLSDIYADATNSHGAPGGIWAPELDSDHDAIHETATGRVFWAVNPQGEVLVHIRRPGQEEPRLCLKAEMKGYEVEARALGSYAPRHVDALERVLSAIRPDVYEWPQLAALRADAPERDPS